MAFIIPFIPLITGAATAGVAAYAANRESNATNQASANQLAASNRASDIESSNFDKSIAAAQDEQDYNRWLTSATAAARQPYLDQLAASLGASFGSYTPSTYTPPTYEAAAPFVAPNPADIEKDPGFQFEKQQGLGEITRTLASRGTALTGGAAKDAATFAEGLAATRSGQARDRALQEYQVNEGNRAAAFDRNTSAGFNAAQLNNQSQYQAASLASQSFSQRLSALGSLAQLAMPTGTYPGPTSGGRTTMPVPGLPVDSRGVPIGHLPWSPGMQASGGGGEDPKIPNVMDTSWGGTGDPANLPFGPSNMGANPAMWGQPTDPSSSWSSALVRRGF